MQASHVRSLVHLQLKTTGFRGAGAEVTWCVFLMHWSRIEARCIVQRGAISDWICHVMPMLTIWSSHNSHKGSSYAWILDALISRRPLPDASLANASLANARGAGPGQPPKDTLTPHDTPRDTPRDTRRHTRRHTRRRHTPRRLASSRLVLPCPLSHLTGARRGKVCALVRCPMFIFWWFRHRHPHLGGNCLITDVAWFRTQSLQVLRRKADFFHLQSPYSDHVKCKTITKRKWEASWCITFPRHLAMQHHGTIQSILPEQSIGCI